MRNRPVSIPSFAHNNKWHPIHVISIDMRFLLDFSFSFNLIFNPLITVKDSSETYFKSTHFSESALVGQGYCHLRLASNQSQTPTPAAMKSAAIIGQSFQSMNHLCPYPESILHLLLIVWKHFSDPLLWVMHILTLPTLPIPLCHLQPCSSKGCKPAFMSPPHWSEGYPRTESFLRGSSYFLCSLLYLALSIYSLPSYPRPTSLMTYGE